MAGSVKEIDKIPYEPIREFIDRRYGGVAGIPGLGIRKMEWREDSLTLVVERDAGEEQKAVRIKTTLTRAKMQGWISLWQADALCCDLLGVHPAEVYGFDAWYAFGAEATPATDAWVEKWIAGASSGVSGRTKLDVEKVIDIRRRRGAGERVCDLAEEFGISSRTVHNVVHGVLWGWVQSDEMQEAAA